MRLGKVSKSSASAARLIVEATREVIAADRRGTLVAAGLQLLGVAASLGVVVSAKLMFDAMLDPGRAELGLVAALVGLALSTGLAGAAGGLQSQQMRLLSELVAQRVWDRVLRRTADADLVSYDSTGFGTTLERIQQHSVTRPFLVCSGLIGLLGGVAGVVTLSVALVRIEPLLVPILLAAGLPAVLMSRWAGRTEFTFARGTTGAQRRRDYLRDLLTQRPYAAEIRAFAAARSLRDRHDRCNREYTEQLRGQVRRRQLLAGLSAAGVAVALVCALLAILALVHRGSIGLSEAGAAAITVRLLSGQLALTFAALGALIESAPFLADLSRFVDGVEQSEVVGRKHVLTDRLRVNAATFRYPGQDRPAIDGVDIEIRAGEIVALVGENGSGKTTLAKIVAGLYRPDHGGLRWDGHPLAEADLRASVSMIFQDFVRYQMTLRDNILISDGNRAPREAELLDAARRAGALRIAAEVPDGLDTMLGRDLDEGVDLSGGQWQRVALARALYRDTPLVVLDEPTAALDPRAEHELFTDVRQVLGGRAALLISHRYSSARLADRIYMMAGGRIVESGTHEELVSQAGQYAELYAVQSAGYH